MLLGKTRKAIADTVSQPSKNAVIYSLLAFTISCIALVMSIVAMHNAH